MSSKFGWSYPAGCSGPPNCDDERPCAICGNIPDDCTCPECQHIVEGYQGEPTPCGQVACLEHFPSHSLSGMIELLEYRLSELKGEAKKREVETTPCPGCGTVHTVSIFTEGPLLCCKYEYNGRGEWELADPGYLWEEE